MVGGSSYVIFLLVFLIVKASADDVILQPIDGKNDPEVALFFAQGADIETEQYTDIMAQLQKEVPFKLWVGIIQCQSNVCSIPNTLKKGCSRVEKDMIDAGMNAQKHFYGGHSLGGAMMPDYLVKNAVDKADGLVLMGSFLTRVYKTGTTAEGRPQMEYPVPVLTIGAELDGLCRITRITENLYTQITFSEDPDHAAGYMPVTVIPGMNHMEFASGEPPSFVYDNDIQPEIEESEAHQLVVEDVSTFMGTIVYPDETTYMSTLKNRVKESQDFTQPIVDALNMESYEMFLPPCYCETPDEYGGKPEYGTCVSMPNCTGGCEWTTQYSQMIMSGVLDHDEVSGLTINNTDSMHFVTEEDPSCHLPHIHGNDTDSSANPGNGNSPPICDSPDGCKLDITTVTQHLYDQSGEVDYWRIHFSVDSLDTGFVPISAVELKTKLKSRQAVWEAAGIPDVDFTQSDKPTKEGGVSDNCAEINAAAVQWALDKLPQSTYDRFQKYGQKLIIGPDLSTCKAGPCWIWDNMKFEKNDEENTVNVQSIWFGSENKNPYPCGTDKQLPCDAGFHYCKLLSPARALEWMYVDGLKNMLGLNKATKAEKTVKRDVVEKKSPSGKDEEKCCEGACPEGTKKYYSIAKRFGIVGQTNCGESCIDPDDEDLYQKFEKNLEPAPDGVDDICYQKGFPNYLKTETHGAGKIAIAVDLYTSNNEICGCLDSDLCSLVPPDGSSGKFPCYQGTQKDATSCFKTDPALANGTTWSCSTCSELGFPNYLRNDPLYKSMELWGP